MNCSKNYLILCLVACLAIVGCSLLEPAATGQTPEASTQLSQTVAPTRTPTPPPTPTEKILQGTVRIWHSWDEPKVAALVQVIEDFRALYPEVNFDVLYVPPVDLLARYRSEVGEGFGPGILLGQAAWGPALYDDRLVVDLSGLVSQELAGSFNPAALDPMKHQQALIGLPYALQGVVLYRNKAIVPEPAATWGALVEKAKESTQGDQVGAVLERSFFFSGGHLPGIGGQLMQPDGGPAFNDEKGLAWVELLRSFEQAGPAEYLSDRDLEMFKEGRVGWIIDGTWNMSSLAEAIGEENLAIDPWPAYSEGGLSGFVQAEDAYLSSRVPENDLEATWKFIEFLASSAGQAHLAEAGFIPAIDGSRGELTVDNPLLGQAISALAGGTAYPVRPEMAVYTVPLDVALRSIFEVNKGPEDALQTASDEIQAAIDALRATPTPVATQTP